jgi:hypothetical protein
LIGASTPQQKLRCYARRRRYAAMQRPYAMQQKATGSDTVAGSAQRTGNQTRPMRGKMYTRQPDNCEASAQRSAAQERPLLNNQNRDNRIKRQRNRRSKPKPNQVPQPRPRGTLRRKVDPGNPGCHRHSRNKPARTVREPTITRRRPPPPPVGIRQTRYAQRRTRRQSHVNHRQHQHDPPRGEWCSNQKNTIE